MVEMAAILDLAQRIVAEFRPHRVVLFGSYARGETGPDSDVDLLVVLPFLGRSLEISLEILNRIQPNFITDLIVRRPEEVKDRYEWGDPLIREAVDQGLVLYESGQGP